MNGQQQLNYDADAAQARLGARIGDQAVTIARLEGVVEALVIENAQLLAKIPAPSVDEDGG